jgi:hypothetical protein
MGLTIKNPFMPMLERVLDSVMRAAPTLTDLRDIDQVTTK